MNNMSKWFKKTKENISNITNKATSGFGKGVKKTKNWFSDIPVVGPWFGIATKNFNKYSMFYILGFIFIVFGIINPNFISANQITNILFDNSYIFIVGLPMLLVIVSGNIDLSVGSLVGFSGAMGVIIFNGIGSQNIILTLILTLLLGAAIGIIQGTMIGYYRIPAFIITLGGMLILQGFQRILLNSQSLLPNGGFNSQFIQFSFLRFPDVNLGSANSPFWIIAFLLMTIIGILIVISSIQRRLKAKRYGLQNESIISFIVKQAMIFSLFIGLGAIIALSQNGLQLYMLYILILIVLFLILTKYTKFGRAVYAIGGNRKAAELSGINSRFTILMVFTIMGVVASFAGIVFAGTVTGSASPNNGVGFELDVIASVFIGGASVYGGIGTVIGTLTGAGIIGALNGGLQSVGISTNLIPIITGFVLVLAVTYDVFSKRKIG